MKNLKKQLFCVTALLLALTGCRTDHYYQAQAIEDARKFLLDHAPELTQEEVLFIRYNDPVFLKGDAIGDPEKLTGDWEHTNSYVRQICIAWRIPGREKLYLVCGFSEERMSFWKPNRLLRKSFGKEVPAQTKALEEAQKYAQNNLLWQLSNEEFNQVRFVYPAICRTDFEVNFNMEGKLTAEGVAEEKKKSENTKQYSLVWRNPDRNIVATGFSNETLMGWKLIFSGIVSDEELQKHTLEVVKTPETFTTPLVTEIK